MLTVARKMRVCRVADGDVLDDGSDTYRCNSPASGRPLSVARHQGHERSLHQLSHGPKSLNSTTAVSS